MTIIKTNEWINSKGIKQGYKISLDIFGGERELDGIAYTETETASLTGHVWSGKPSQTALGLGIKDNKIGPLHVTDAIAMQYAADYAELANHPEYVAYMALEAAAEAVHINAARENRKLYNTMTLNGRSY